MGRRGHRTVDRPGTMAGASRRRVGAGCAFAAVAVLSTVARADGWPVVGEEWLNSASRDPNGGLALVQLACWWVGFAGWATTSDWLFRDSTRNKLRPEFWTAWAVFPFVACAVLAWWIPWSAAGQGLMALAWILPLFLYSRERNPKVPASESILTRGHLQRALQAGMGLFGVKSKTVAIEDNGLPWVKLVATSAETPEENQKWQEEAAASPGFESAKKLLQEAAAARASRVVIESSADGVRVAHEVDGIMGPARGVTTKAKGRGKSRQPDIWGDARPLEAAAGTAALAVLSTIAGADAAKLSGEPDSGFTIEVDGKKRSCRLATRSTKTAKQTVLSMGLPPFAPKKLEDLGMPSALANRVRELIALEKGLFVVSSPSASGCSTTFDTLLLSADRLLRDFVSIEEVGAPPIEVQNIKPMKYSARAGETPISALTRAMLEYPSAIVTRDLTDVALAGELMKLADDKQLVLVSVRAADAIDAIQKLLDLGIPRDQLARCLLGSLSQRLIRKLCVKCGEPVPTPPELLQRLKMTAEALPTVKRASPHGGCQVCFGRQFVGRTGIYELAAGPTVRQAIAQKVDPKVLRQAAIKDGMRPLADEGLGAVAAGVSSLDEIQRAFAVKKEAGPSGSKK